MPFSGTFWSVKEIQEILKVSRQRVFGLAKEYDWESPFPGLFRGGVGRGQGYPRCLHFRPEQGENSRLRPAYLE